ncbi:MAG TPA: hypothetical protein DEA51_03145 [Erysipelotrichaceae bacterium]|nr:hypothetical protein [Erysipelotrichaceae bacterium]
MKDQSSKSFILSSLVVLLLSGILLFLLFFLYFGFTLLVELTLYRDNPQGMSYDSLRLIFAFIVMFILGGVMKLKVHRIIKGTAMTVGLALYYIAIYLSMFRFGFVSIIVIAISIGFVLYMMIRMKVPTFYYVCLVFSLVGALAYGFPG